MKIKKAPFITGTLIICSMMIASLFIFESGRLFLYTQLALNGPESKAVWAMNKISEYENCNESLKICLNSRSWVVRENSAFMLSNLSRNDEDLTNLLCKLIPIEQDDAVKIEFIILLANNMVINDNVIDLMEKEKSSADERVRYSILSNIKSFSDFSTNNPDLKRQLDVYRPQLHTVVTDMIKTEKDPKFTSLILEYLSSSSAEPAPEHLNFLLVHITDASDRWIRGMAALAISKYSPETEEKYQIIPKLNSKLETVDDSQVQEDIMEAIITLSRGK